MKIHEKYINRCLELAKKGLGYTYPNPLVGSVIVYNEKIIGEGWHHQAGLAHAEVNAINAVKDTSLLKKATLYVNLEPCSHYGKTPPCSDLIIEKGIKHVVIGTTDPFAKVAGRGIQKLLNAGCQVTVGVLEEACNEVNKRFFTFHKHKRPYIILKWAETNDGFIAPEHQEVGKPFWITSAAAKQLVHQWRSQEAGILIGTNTALKDNPKLDTRLWYGKSPVKIILDQTLKVPKQVNVFTGEKTLCIIGNKTTPPTNANHHAIDFSKNLATQVCKIAYTEEIQSIIIEGGKQTLQTFINENLWDEARVFTGKTMLHKGIKAPILQSAATYKTNLSTDELTFYKNKY